MSSKKKFQKELDKIIGASIEEELDQLEDENGEPVEKEPYEIVRYDEVESALPKPEEPNDRYDDYVYSRSVLHGLIDRGTTALEGALHLARDEEHPRAYEVTSNLMRNISDLTKNLMELQDRMEGKGSGDGKSIGTQNNVQHNYYGGKEQTDKEIFDELDSLEDEDDKAKDS